MDTRDKTRTEFKSLASQLSDEPRKAVLQVVKLIFLMEYPFYHVFYKN
jgi:hypothetical protein